MTGFGFGLSIKPPPRRTDEPGPDGEDGELVDDNGVDFELIDDNGTDFMMIED